MRQEAQVPFPAFEREDTRRGFLGWMGKIGLGTVGGIAGLVALDSKAFACSWYCCDLNFCPPNCPTDSSGFAYCRQGYTMAVWHCCVGSVTYACGECVVSGTDCHQTSNCSTIWMTNRDRCACPCNP